MNCEGEVDEETFVDRPSDLAKERCRIQGAWPMNGPRQAISLQGHTHL